MNFLFTMTAVLLFGTSLYFASWASSIVCSLLLLLTIWTRLFSSRIIKRDFKNLTHIKNTPLHHLNENLMEAFTATADVLRPNIFVDLSAKNLQIYSFGSKKNPQIIASKSLLEKVSAKDLEALLNYAGILHVKKTFSRKQSFVAILIYLGNLGRYIDAGLSFVLGIKTESGEPRALIRRPLYFILNKSSQIARYQRKKSANLQLQNYSYLSFEHLNPVVSPLSVADRAL